MGALNRGVLAIQEAMGNLSGASSAMGMEQFMLQMEQMAQQQLGINRKTFDLFNKGQLTLEEQAALARLSAEQEAVKRAVEEMLKNYRQHSEVIGRLDRMIEDMEGVVSDLRQQNASSETIRRQERILSRLLDAQHSVRRRDFSRKRKSITGRDVIRESPLISIDATAEWKEQIRRDILRIAQEGFTRDYQELIKRYFEALMREENRSRQEHRECPGLLRLIIEIGLDCDMKSWLFQDKKMKFLSIIIFLGLMALQYFRVYAQDPGQALKRAQELEKFGRVDEAREVYEQTYRQHPDNIVGFNRLKEFYVRFQEYDLACGLIKERQKRYPGDPSLTVSLAQVLYKMGEDKKAITLWHGLLEEYPQKSSIVQLVASAMTMERLYDRAIEVYINGRNRIGRGDLFIFNLSNLYAAQMDFAKAADELLLYLEFHPEQSSLIESQLKRFPKTSRVVREVVDRIERDIVHRPRDINL
ncbi:hypothetical protein KA005_37515, partial [bacterium]|nr:hypothetical protein [bacterium]